MKGSPIFDEVVLCLEQSGFVAYDVRLYWNRPLDSVLTQVDIVFVK